MGPRAPISTAPCTPCAGRAGRVIVPTPTTLPLPSPFATTIANHPFLRTTGGWPFSPHLPRHHYCVASPTAPLLLAVSRAVSLRAAAVLAVGSAAIGVAVSGAAGSVPFQLPLRVSSSVTDIIAERGEIRISHKGSRAPTSLPLPHIVL